MIWPNFICEACTVRAVLKRELHGKHDVNLLCYERMRLLDIANSWSGGTHQQYLGKLRIVSRFEGAFGVKILRPTYLEKPPTSRSIPLMWMQEHYSLQKSYLARRRKEQELTTVTFGAIRQLRSAVSQYATMDQLMTDPDHMFYDQQKRVLHHPGRYTDSVGCTLFAGGLSKRLGDQTKPSTALLDRHVRFLDTNLNTRFLNARNDAKRLELAKAGLANLIFWLGWLRSTEAFSLRFSDCELTLPADGPRHDLPPGIGALHLNLQQTKSSPTATAAVILAYQTVSGLCVGKWFRRVCELSQIDHQNLGQEGAHIFQHPTGGQWDSAYFRETYLYPCLYLMQADGDKALTPFDGTPGNSIEHKFWSLHCYRRGARSAVSKSSGFSPKFKRANADQIYEHARWLRKRSSEKIDVMYREWLIVDRIMITLWSQ